MDAPLEGAELDAVVETYHRVRRIRQRQYEVRQQTTVKLPDIKKWYGRVSYRRCEDIALILLRMSMPADIQYDWLAGIPRQRMPWSEWRKHDYAEEKRFTNRATRDPPLPNWERLYPNQCPCCGQPTYGRGAWWPEAGPALFKKQWHLPCQSAYQTWRHADFLAHSLAIRQSGVCPITGEAIVRERERRVFRDGVHATETDQVVIGGVEVDHIVPLWRVRRDAHLYQWPEVLRFWGPTNLQALSGEGHKIKCAQEARERAGKV